MFALAIEVPASKINTCYRFGQNVVQDCDYCHTLGEYALYALPGVVLLYLREAFVIGVVTIRGTHRERWRIYGIGLLVFAFIVEIYWTLSVKIQISQGNSYGVVMVRLGHFITVKKDSSSSPVARHVVDHPASALFIPTFDHPLSLPRIGIRVPISHGPRDYRCSPITHEKDPVDEIHKRCDRAGTGTSAGRWRILGEDKERGTLGKGR